MVLKTLRDLKDKDLKGKRILLRVAYDITLKKEEGKWTVPDDRRIRETLPTINYLLERKCQIVLMSWLQRPGGKLVERYRMDPVAFKLSEILKKPVKKVNECIGKKVEKAIQAMKPGDLLMLENTRFHPQEEKADLRFARELAKAGEIIVFDAFAQAHRIHASTTGILEIKSGVAGFLMEKELRVLTKVVESPLEPFVVILGGAKISDKVEMMKNLIKKADIILIGGALANTFFQAKGLRLGASLVNGSYVDIAKGEKEDYLALARDLLEKVKKEKIAEELIPQNWPNNHKVKLSKIQLPLDVMIVRRLGEDKFDDETIKIIKLNKEINLCKKDEAILDIGPYTVKIFSEIIKKGRTIFWNGPMGLFETFDFSAGTKAIAQVVAESTGFSVIGGGDTEGVVSKFNLEGKFGHVSTGGGASLELLAGVELPVLKYLRK